MKIGVLSDTHLQRVDHALIRLFDLFLKDADYILHAGDYVSNNITMFFSQDHFHGVYGNMDRPEVQELLPSQKVIEIGSHRIGLIHGWGSADSLEERIQPAFKDQEVDIIVYGHSHRPANHIKNGVLFFNPGTAFGYSSFGIHSIGLLHIEDRIRGEIIQI